jgi:hypothetical protein
MESSKLRVKTVGDHDPEKDTILYTAFRVNRLHVTLMHHS